jgi:hypothetical protein
MGQIRKSHLLEKIIEGKNIINIRQRTKLQWSDILIENKSRTLSPAQEERHVNRKKQ